MPDKIENSESYPWHLLTRTIFLVVTFLVLGLLVTVNGPTLLDLKDLLGASIGQISFIFLLGSIGGLIGCSLVGILLDKLKRFSYLICGFLLIGLGFSSAMFPYSPNLPAIYAVSFVTGLLNSAFDSAGQMVLFETWAGRDSGPYMHALHFMFGLGAFISPLLAKPFLFNSSEIDVHSLDLSGQTSGNASREVRNSPFVLEGSNTSSQSSLSGEAYNSSDQSLFFREHTWTIKALYPLLGTLPVVCGCMFFVYFCVDLRKVKIVVTDAEKEELKEKGRFPGGRSLVVVVAMVLFFFLYVGQEVAYGTFITAFSVQSKLGLSRQEGSDVTAIFWGTFAATRGLAIPAAIFLNPQEIMTLSCTICLVGATLLSVLGEVYWEVFYVGSAVMGAGMASVYATGLLWMEKHVKMNSRILTTMVIAGALGVKVFPLLVGQTIEKHPASFLYLNLAITIGCSLLYLLSSLIAKTIPRSLKADEEEKAEPTVTYAQVSQQATSDLA